MYKISTINYLNKVIPNHYISKLCVVYKLLRKGYSKQNIYFSLSDTTINVNAFRTSTSKKEYFIDLGGTLIKKYDKNIDGKSVLEDPEVEKNRFKPKQKLFKNILLLLSCSGTAELGNYFYSPSRLWQITSFYFPERLMKGLDFAAIDCISLNLNDNKGSIVFENNMERVSKHNICPFLYNYTEEEKNKLIQLTYKDLLYVFDKLKYKHLIVYMHVKIYKETFISALKLLKEHKNKITLILLPLGHGGFLTNLPILRKKYKEIRYKIKNNIPTKYEEIKYEKEN